MVTVRLVSVNQLLVSGLPCNNLITTCSTFDVCIHRVETGKVLKETSVSRLQQTVRKK